MKIRTLTELNQFLDAELVWRKKELTSFRFTVDRARQHETGGLVRGAVCLLYAHWEGFVKAAATSYVCYVATRRLKYQELAPSLVALGLRSLIIEAGQSKRATIHTRLTAKLLSDLADRFQIDCDGAIDTASNLNTNVLQDILCVLGLDATPYLDKKFLIDNRLLANRNRIAHGKFLYVDEVDYRFIQSEVIGLIDRFRDDVENAAALKLYLRQETPLVHLRMHGARRCGYAVRFPPAVYRRGIEFHAEL